MGLFSFLRRKKRERFQHTIRGLSRERRGRARLDRFMKYLETVATRKREVTELQRETKELGFEEILKSTEYFDNLFLVYRTDSITRRAIDLWADMIVTNITIQHPDERVREKYRQWVEETNLSEVLMWMCKLNFIAGRAVCKMLINEDEGTLYFELLNPKDYKVMRDNYGKIRLNSKGQIIGFEIEQVGKPKEELLREKAFYFSFFSLGPHPFGVSPLETIYKDATIADNLKTALGEIYYRQGTPLYVYTVGTEEHPFTEEEAEEAMKALQNMSERTAMIIPYWHRLEVQSPRLPRGIGDPVLIFESEKACGLGIPLALLLTGAVRRGEAVRDQLILMEREVRRYQRIIKRAIERQIFPVLHRLWNFQNELPTVLFEEISAQHLATKIGRITEMARADLITPDRKTENYLRTLEGLPMKEEISYTEELERRLKRMEGLLNRLIQKIGTIED